MKPAIFLNLVSMPSSDGGVKYRASAVPVTLGNKAIYSTGRVGSGTGSSRLRAIPLLYDVEMHRES